MSFHFRFVSIGLSVVVLALSSVLSPLQAQALEVDWSGQFRFEFNTVHNYSMDGSNQGSQLDAARQNGGAYYVPGGGSTNADFQNLFLRVRPKVIVNDNIAIKSEWWVGDPVYGLFGNSVPYSREQQAYNSTSSRGVALTAQRFWGEFQSDFGTFQIGRAPLSWGLGIVWNPGDGLWDRYMSTGDTVRLIAKFGSFSVIPSFISYSTGNTIGGSCQYSSVSGDCTTGQGSGGVIDYSFAFKYENPDDEFEGGVNLIRRLAGANQDANSGFRGPQANTPVAMNYSTWDIYGRKKIGKITIAGELPIVTGSIGGADYKTWALATELDWRMSDTWETRLRAGHAPGQPALGSPTIDKYKAFYFHPNYHLGMIMFNYQLANFSGLQTQNNPAAGQQNLKSPYDNPIVNANYAAFTGILHADKWSFRGSFVIAGAAETAANNKNFYNTWKRKVATNTAGTSTVTAVKDQGASMGWEMDYGTTFQWDDTFQFNWDFGFFFPGSYYAFSNTTTDNKTSMVWGTTAKVGVSF